MIQEPCRASRVQIRDRLRTVPGCAAVRNRISSGAIVKLTPSVQLFGLLLLALALSGAVVAFSEQTCIGG